MVYVLIAQSGKTVVYLSHQPDKPYSIGNPPSLCYLYRWGSIPQNSIEPVISKVRRNV